MAGKGGRSQIVLDWFNVSYKSVFLIVCAGIAVIAGGVTYWVYSTRAPASRAIREAAVEYERASAFGGDPRWTEPLGNARASLGEARSQFQGRSFRAAKESAERSAAWSRRVLRSSGDKSDAKQVHFSRIEGDVRVKRAGQFAWESAHRDTALSIGDQVKTSSSASAQIVYFDGTKTTIQPGSLLEIKDLYENPVTKVRKVAEKLNWGEVTASTQRHNVDGSFHEIKTEAAAAKSEDEAEVHVAYDADKGTASFDVFGGRVEVAGPDRKEVLGPGERIRASSDGRLASKEVLPGVPRLVSPPDQRVFIYEDPAAATTRLAWERVPGAARYHLMISDRYLFTHCLYDAHRSETDVVIDGITPGDYYWKVAAVSPSGVQGPFSEGRGFRVATQSIRDTTDTTPPALEITDLVQTGAMLILNGKTEPGAQVWVGNDKVDVADDGTFYTVVRLRKEGWNDLSVVAQDAAGNQATVNEKAYVEIY